MKIFGFREKKKKFNGNLFRNIVANTIICLILATMLGLTYAGGSLNAFSSNEPSPIYNGNLSSNKISLMINVYWGNEFIEPMLKTLKDNDVKTTFFVGGMWAEKYPDLLKEIYNEGHEIANHGYFHKDQNLLNLDGNKKEINDCHNIVKKTINVDMNLFAPPSGAFNKSTLTAAESLGYKVIMWTRDTIDWRDQDSEIIFKRATQNAKGGDLVLMHPTKATAAALENIIKELKTKFELTTVSNCLNA